MELKFVDICVGLSWGDEGKGKIVSQLSKNNEYSNCSNSCSPFKCTSFDDHLNYMNISMGNDGLH